MYKVLVLSISNAQLVISCINILTDETGSYNYKFHISSELTEYVTARMIGFKNVETASFKISPGDSIELDFYLAIDDRPIINCETK